MPPVSIIVPVHNAEKTIDRCINSILNQKYRDFELLLLDDGSTDESGKLCDGYSEKDPRIRVLHKENSGVSDTRNQGIDMANGEYLQFIDSDDWIIPEATEFLVRAAEDNGCDMVISDFYRVIGERVSQKGTIEEEGILSREDYALRMMQNPADFYYGVLWNKLYKRSIIEQYHLRMDSSVSWSEDFIFNLDYVKHTNRIYVCKIPVYYYMKTKGSLISQGTSVKKTVQMKRRVFVSYNDFYKDVFGAEDYEKKKGKVYRFLFDIASDGGVPPLSIQGSYKLGNERTRVSESALDGDGIFFDTYHERKLQEKLFDIAALRNDLSTDDVKLLYYLSQPRKNCTLHETADILNIPERKLSSSVQKLLSKEMIAEQDREAPNPDEEPTDKNQSEKKRLGRKEYVVTHEAENVMSEVMFLLCDFERIQYEGFSPEETDLYERLNEKRKQNIRAALRESSLP